MIDPRDLGRIRRDRDLFIKTLVGDCKAAILKGDTLRCPFHDDTNPSAKIYVDCEGTHRLVCFACSWNDGRRDGDILDIVQRAHGVDFPAACERLGLVDPDKNGSASSNGHAKDAATSPQNRAIERNGHGLPDGTPATAASERTQSGGGNAPGETSKPGRTFPTLEKCIDAIVGIVRFKNDGRGELCGHWLYENLDGSPAMAVVRINTPTPDGPGEKEFRPAHPTTDGWAIGDPPGKLPLYNLPELAAADVVYVCEGEKAADAARSIGLAATTSAHGSSAADKSDWTPLAGKRVVILPDHDDAGRKYAATVKATLGGLNPPALDVGTIELPGLGDKGDVADYIDARPGVAPDDIRRGIQELVDAADPWRGTSIGQIWASPRTWAPVTYISTGLRWLDSRLCGGIRTKGCSVLCGKTGQGKTQMAVTCAVNAARAKFPTAILSLELTAPTVSKLIAAQLGNIPRNALDTGNLGGDYAAKLRDVQHQFSALPLSIVDYARWPGGLTREDCTALVSAGVRRFGWRMVILDYLGLLVPSVIDRDQYDTDVRHSAELKRLADELDIALVCVAATRKGATFRTVEQMTIDDVLGAGRLAYDAQLVLGVGCEHGEKNCGLIKVRPFKNRYGPCNDTDPPVDLRWRPMTGRIEDLAYDEHAGGADIGCDYDADEEVRIQDEIRNEDGEGGVEI